MRKTILAGAIGVLALSGCASMTDYNLYAQTQQMIAQKNAEAEIARANALKDIAASGDSAAKVAAVMSLQFSAQNQQKQQQIAAPSSMGDTMLKWASVLVPSLTQFYAIGKSADVAVVNSNNAKDVSISTTRGMVDMGKLIGGKEVPVIGGPDDRLLYPEPTNTTVTNAE
jgi:cell pole-organizing protein PopZ